MLYIGLGSGVLCILYIGLVVAEVCFGLGWARYRVVGYSGLDWVF